MRNSADTIWRPVVVGLLAGVLWLIWQAVRLPALVLLLILEPIVSVLLSAVALFGVLAALFWYLTSNRPSLPFLGMLAVSVGCFLSLVLYQGLLRLLVGRRS